MKSICVRANANSEVFTADFSNGSVAGVKRWHVAVSGLLFAILVFSIVVLVMHFEYTSQTEHETDRWAVIQDVNGDRLAVEPVSEEVWSELVQLHWNGTGMFVGGIVERSSNKWGFRFKPDTVTVAQVTAEGLQAKIRDISTNIDDWLDLGWAYVGAHVVEIHLES